MFHSLRKIAVSLFVVFHTSAVISWVLPPYADMVVTGPPSATLPTRTERLIFSGLKQTENHFISRILEVYIDNIGAHQYWDFFAPQAPVVHRYLRVCGNINPKPIGETIECDDLLYKSYNGSLDDAIQSFDGRRSRSFRLTENLIRLERPDLLQDFTQYWLNRNTHGTPARGSQGYLVLTEYTLRPRHKIPGLEAKRQDTVIWITSF